MNLGRFSAALFAATVLAGVAPVQAADMPLKAKAPIATYNWTGLYVGLNAGVGAQGVTAITVLPTALPDRDDLTRSGFTGGAQAGYNYQFAPSWVAGIEGDINSLSLSRTICALQNCTGGANQFDATAKTDWFATLRARLGYAFGQSMLYATGGLAVVHSTDEWSNFNNTPRVVQTQNRSGWTAGGGIETALTGNWTAKVEYLYIDTGTSRVNDPNAAGAFVDFKHQYQLARLGLNYRFGGSQAAMAYASASGAPVFNWSGFYVGGNAGAVASLTRFDASATFAGSADNVDRYGTGFAGGVQAGYNWQVARNWVVGVEGDFGVLSTNRSTVAINTQTPGNDVLISSKTDWAGTVRGRLGYAWDRSLLFATGGAAVVHVTDAWTNTGAFYAETVSSKWGWTAGGGIETALMGNWTAKAEYLYIDAGKVTVADAATPGGPGATFTHQYHVARLGLNYHFAMR